MNALDELTNLSSSVSNPAIQEWKSKNKKIVGFLCSHVPEEILYAADILPIRLRAPGCTETTTADIYMSRLNCTFVRSCLEFMHNGKYDFLDGFICTNSCDHTRRLYDVMRVTLNYPFVHFLSVPHKVNGEITASWYRDECTSLKKSIESTFGVDITETKLRNAIDIYNETRSLLKRIYDLRKGQAPPISGTEMLSVIVAAGTIPRDQYNQLLRTLLDELSEKEGLSDYRARLMIAGSGGCDDPAYFQVMEDLGGLIVTDSLCYGSRSFWEPVIEKDDLMLGLASSYLKRPSCANMTDRISERSNYVKDMVKDFNVDGVVFQGMRYCDLWAGQLVHLRKKLNESNIPLLSLDREYMLGGVGQLRTRVQAFIESIEG